MDDLHHRSPFVAAARREVFDHVDVCSGRQRAVSFVRGRTAEIVEAVGEHTNPDAGAVDAQSALIQGLLHLRSGGAAGADARISDSFEGSDRRVIQARHNSGGRWGGCKRTSQCHHAAGVRGHGCLNTGMGNLVAEYSCRR